MALNKGVKGLLSFVSKIFIARVTVPFGTTSKSTQQNNFKGFKVHIDTLLCINFEAHSIYTPVINGKS